MAILRTEGVKICRAIKTMARHIKSPVSVSYCCFLTYSAYYAWTEISDHLFIPSINIYWVPMMFQALRTMIHFLYSKPCHGHPESPLHSGLCYMEARPQETDHWPMCLAGRSLGWPSCCPSPEQYRKNRSRQSHGKHSADLTRCSLLSSNLFSLELWHIPRQKRRPMGGSVGQVKRECVEKSCKWLKLTFYPMWQGGDSK